jgi:hypothetical protein
MGPASFLTFFLQVLNCIVRRDSYFSPEDGDSIFLRNFGIYLRVYTASQPRKTTSSTVSDGCFDLVRFCCFLMGCLGFECHILHRQARNSGFEVPDYFKRKAENSRPAAKSH